MRSVVLTAVMAVAALGAGPVAAQNYGGGRQPSAILFDQPNFQGRQTTIYGLATNLPRDWNDKTMSARFQGRWRVCEDSDFRGRCQDVTGDVPNMNSLGMAERITSLQAYSGAGGGGGFGPPPGGSWRPGGGNWSGPNQYRPTEGVRSVFFPYPTYEGYDIAAGSSSANAFCRSQGLGSSAYYDSSQRAQQAIDGEGRYTGPTSVLRDVVCRRN
ncbi:MAG: beta/gamma crystallin-related protein [Phenylobacterium sp.]|uniref:beta/gamma crystallin-related protein n=1 Tax=Phenylobacterium sp. TaxID=1871053 RepID=UPI002728FEE1|nr:beta/gamma crystallin-related protein [Phenylobacterium sp.]MDO8902256.1 beta/gamma crystallin-related protein [Phenylobacterium sp.]MDP2212725.1 beta/gamma crystallin-related protein [Phenylobacterium sp.]